MSFKDRLTSCARRTPLLKRCVAPVQPEHRTIFINGTPVAQGEHEAVISERFCDNRIKTTKYEPYNFIFKNLFEQFLRIANTYFLIVAIIQFTIPNTPVSPITSALPLAFVLACTAVKQAYEDYLRRKEDNKVNRRLYKIVKDGQLKQAESQNIQVGDIVRVETNEEFPCDLVLLSSSDPQGQCSIQTANLDGETNLKIFVSIPETKSRDNPEKLSPLRGVINCQQPITDLYTFVGKAILYLDENKPPITKALIAQNLLLRGAKLKDQDYIYGCAVYTGQETKMSLNSEMSSGKRSRVERRLNTFLIIFMVYLCISCILATSLRYAFLNSWLGENNSRPQWYLPLSFDYRSDDGTVTALQVILDFLYFYVIFNYIIPISLYVTIELQKFVGSMFFGFDAQMYDERIDERAKANTSDLNEELGQVEYLFCDKTGTLTENIMQFKQCSVNGVRYEERGGKFVQCTDTVDSNTAVSSADKPDDSEMVPFLEVLALCHTVQIEKKTPSDSRSLNSIAPGIDEVDAVDDSHTYQYHASSPDEKALVEACRKFGVVYHGNEDDKLKISFHGKSRYYTLHQVLEFDSDRKCMSVIIENDLGEYMVLCKGAESAVLKRCVSGSTIDILNDVDHYAGLGLRTLVIAGKKITEEEFNKFIDLIEAAKQDLENRDAALVAAYDEIEQGFHAFGATAVEDKLQEGVKETLEKLSEAGIKVWVLTGDKEETAVNISYSAGHFHPKATILGFTLQTSEAEAYSHLLSLKDSANALKRDRMKSALVVDGASLALILNRYDEAFREVCMLCDSVLCCRMTPIQKAKVVRLVKNSPADPTTAAIGDGANDVSMIQEAHVGLGIMGKEGRQAARSSDYAFGKFKFLLRVILVHGHYYYVRLSILVQYFFFKNIAFITANFYFMFFNTYSALSVFDTIFLLFYNITFTSLPVYLHGLFEQNIPQEYLLEYPQLYRGIKKNRLLSFKNFILWTVLGIWYSIVATFGIYITYMSRDELVSEGKSSNVFAYGTAILFVAHMSVNIKLMIETYYWTWITVAGYAITFFCNWGMIAIYCKWTSTFQPDDTSMTGVLGVLFESASFWLTVIVLVMISILPDLILRVWRDTTTPVYRKISKSRNICCGIARRTSFDIKHTTFVNSSESVDNGGNKKKIPKSNDIELSYAGISVTNYKKSESDGSSMTIQGHDNMAADFSE